MNGILAKKIENFFNSNRKSKKAFTTKVRDFQRRECDYTRPEFTTNDLLNKIINNPICYLSGREIDLLRGETYHLDHILPNSRGGDNSIENLGLATKEANIGKSNLTIREYIDLCVDILTTHGYNVSKQ